MEQFGFIMEVYGLKNYKFKNEKTFAFFSIPPIIPRVCTRPDCV
ncbi:MAG: hypothetical protein ACD_78C00208G0001, partial [uncultured bacterium (gcode 4)]